MWSFYLRKVIPTDALFKNYVIRKLGLTETDLKYDKNNMKIKYHHLFKNKGMLSFEDETIFKEDRMWYPVLKSYPLARILRHEKNKIKIK